MDTIANLFDLEAEVLSALAHPTRLEILELLRGGECCVCHIQTTLDQRQAYVSQHLMLLRQSGILIARKEGKRVYYSVSNPQVFKLIDSLIAYLKSQKRWQVKFPTEDLVISPRTPCNCPQCVPSPA